MGVHQTWLPILALLKLNVCKLLHMKCWKPLTKVPFCFRTCFATVLIKALNMTSAKKQCLFCTWRTRWSCFLPFESGVYPHFAASVLEMTIFFSFPLKHQLRANVSYAVLPNDLREMLQRRLGDLERQLLSKVAELEDEKSLLHNETSAHRQKTETALNALLERVSELEKGNLCRI